MSVFYRLHQSTNEDPSMNGKWYARAVPTTLITTKELAEIMQRNCTVKKADIVAVIAELVDTMRDQLQQSHRVKIDGLGSFKLGLNSTGSATAAALDVRKNIKGVHVVFTPEVTHDSAGSRTKVLLEGVTVAELPKNMVNTDRPQP